MQSKEQTANNFELSSQGYALFVEAFASANKRTLEYTKSLWEIASRPYASTAVETIARENFDRANQIFSLTIGELQTSGEKSAEFGQKLVAHGTKVQEAAVAATKGLVETSVSNAHFVKESATAQFEDMSKRFEEVQARTVAAASSN